MAALQEEAVLARNAPVRLASCTLFAGTVAGLAGEVRSVPVVFFKKKRKTNII